MRSYATASQTLQDLLSTPELQKANVESTMDNLSNLMADQKEVEAVLQGGHGDVDEDELEKELAGMVLNEEEEEQERERKLLQLKAPSGNLEDQLGKEEQRQEKKEALPA